jgi:membrane protein implicated in regulation of membrane protease activity
LLFQIPGWVAICLFVAWLWPRTDWPLWSAVATVSAWVFKDVLLYPWVRGAYDRGSWSDPARLCGREGVVTRDLDPVGYVRLGSELWRARSACGDRVARGSPVRVQAADGLMLEVAPRGRAPGEGLAVATEAREAVSKHT